VKADDLESIIIIMLESFIGHVDYVGRT